MDINRVRLLQEVVNEAGDLRGITPYDLTGKDEFITDSNKKVTVKFDLISLTELYSMANVPPKFSLTIRGSKTEEKPIYNLTFLVENEELQATRTTLKEYYRIIKTVFIIAEDFIKTKSPFALCVFTTPKIKDGDMTQKYAFYEMINSQNLPQGYTADEVQLKDFLGGNRGLIIYKKK